MENWKNKVNKKGKWKDNSELQLRELSIGLGELKSFYK